MRRRFLSVVLAVGALAGYASGFAHLSRHHREGSRGSCPREAPAAVPQPPAAPGPG